jgi:hypothetical protein
MQNSREVEDKMMRHKTRLVLGSAIAVLLLFSVLGYALNRICSGYWAIGGMIREGSALIPSAIRNMPFSGLFQIMLICVIVAIAGVVAGLIIARKPASMIKIENKTDNNLS